jgi:hypothetical protein
VGLRPTGRAETARRAASRQGLAPWRARRRQPPGPSGAPERIHHVPHGADPPVEKGDLFAAAGLLPESSDDERRDDPLGPETGCVVIHQATDRRTAGARPSRSGFPLEVGGDRIGRRDDRPVVTKRLPEQCGRISHGLKPLLRRSKPFLSRSKRTSQRSDTTSPRSKATSQRSNPFPSVSKPTSPACEALSSVRDRDRFRSDTLRSVSKILLRWNEVLCFR